MESYLNPVPKCLKMADFVYENYVLYVSLNIRVQGSRFKVQGSRFKVQGSGFKVQGSGFKVQGSGFKVQGTLAYQLARQRCTTNFQ